jgi:hypothetical protein
MGRVMTSHVEVTGFDLPTTFSHIGRFENMLERVSYTFGAVSEGTRASLAGETEMGRFGELLAPRFFRMMSRQVQSLFKSLKVVLEPPDPPTRESRSGNCQPAGR